jgi:hypothetical protein
LLDLLSARYADDGHDLKGGRMPTHSEVVRHNLEFYRKQAKALLRASKAGDSKATQRLHFYSPKLESNAVPALHDAQLAVALRARLRELATLSGVPGRIKLKFSGTGSRVHRRGRV